jgi:hypothetical protein
MKITSCGAAFFLLLIGAPAAHAQAAASGEEEQAEEKVRYVLILPDEKTPETVKAEENNPFESPTDPLSKDGADTEENKVRDILLGMHVGGTSSGAQGMSVMLGGMRLLPGLDVPKVLPDQQVRLQVKSVTPEAIELVWVEKKPTGLPPKSLVIPIDGAPKIRYVMPSSKESSGGIGTFSRTPGASSITAGETASVRRATLVQKNEAAPATAMVQTPATAQKPASKPAAPSPPPAVPEPEKGVAAANATPPVEAKAAEAPEPAKVAAASSDLPPLTRQGAPSTSLARLLTAPAAPQESAPPEPTSAPPAPAVVKAAPAEPAPAADTPPPAPEKPARQEMLVEIKAEPLEDEPVQKPVAVAQAKPAEPAPVTAPPPAVTLVPEKAPGTPAPASAAAEDEPDARPEAAVLRMLFGKRPQVK